MRRLSYVVIGADGRPFHTTSYAEATKPGRKIKETLLTEVRDPEDEKAVAEQVEFWRKYKK